jgi:serine/threonine protein kinase
MSKYNIDKCLQSGSYGDVFTCRNNENQKEYACKRYKKEKKHYARDEYYIINYCNHKNIIKVKDLVFIDYLETNKINVYTAKNFALQICNALDYLHNTLFIVHRDVKLENILVKDKTLKLCDFNFAEKYKKDVKKRYKTYGTVDYMCPELMLWNSIKRLNGPEIDIWAFGVVFYVMVTDRLPFDLYNKTLITKKSFRREIVLNKYYEDILSECFSKRRRNIRDVIKKINKIKVTPHIINFEFKVPKLFTTYKRTRTMSEYRMPHTL